MFVSYRTEADEIAMCECDIGSVRCIGQEHFVRETCHVILAYVVVP